MPKTKSLTGHLYKRGNNFSVQFRINGKVKSFALHTTIRREAEQKAAELAKVVGADTKESVAAYVAEARKFRKSSSLSIDDAWDAFFASAERPDCGSSTLRKYKCFWSQFVSWVKINRPALDKIGEVDLETTGEYFSQLSQKKLSGAGFNGHRQALHLVFRILKSQAGMDINPIDDIAKKQNLQRSHKELSAEQLKELLAVFDRSGLSLMNKEEMRVMFHLGTFTGLRLADCALLKWDGVDLDRHTVSSMPLKTIRKAKTVVIPLHPTLEVELLKAKNWSDDSGYVLPKVAARYQNNPSGIQKDAVWIFEQAGMKTTEKIKGRELSVNQFGFHSLRHTFVSICANAGVPLAVVQSIVGHGNPAMTRHYTHIGDASARKAIASLPSLLPANADMVRLSGIRAEAHSLIDAAVEKDIAAILDFLRGKAKDLKLA